MNDRRSEAARRAWARPEYRRRRRDLAEIRKSQVYQEALARGDKFTAGFAQMCDEAGRPDPDAPRTVMVLFPGGPP